MPSFPYSCMILYIVRGLVNMMLIWTSNVFFQIIFFITNGLKQAKQNFYSFKLISHLIFLIWLIVILM